MVYLYLVLSFIHSKKSHTDLHKKN